MYGKDIGAAVCVRERDGDRHLAPQCRILRLELAHLDDLLVRHELHEAAVVRVGVQGRLTGPGRRVVRERDAEGAAFASLPTSLPSDSVGGVSEAEGTLIDRARARYAASDWVSAYKTFIQAQSEHELEADDLERLALVAGLAGSDRDMIAALERLFALCTKGKDCGRAARAAFWAAMRLFGLGERGRAGGWLSRAKKAADESGPDCPIHGYLLLPMVMRHLGAGDLDAAAKAASDAAAFGERVGEPDLVSFASSLEGRALVRQARVDEGLRLLDEAMLAVTSDELSPLVTGIVYCQAIATCQQICALDRAREWTRALAAWCERQPGVKFSSNCRVHRSEVFQLGGDWGPALDEVDLICHGSVEEDPDVFGDAYYQRGELLRLQGRFEEAERAYQIASEHGTEPQPGLALLRLARGNTQSAQESIRRVLGTTAAGWLRIRFLPAFVEIMLAADARDEARTGVEELSELATQFDIDILSAISAHSRGALLLAENQAEAAVTPLREAFSKWQRAGAPYIAARIRVLLSRAYRTLGDTDGATLEVSAARSVFEELGARSDLEALGDEGHSIAPSDDHGLSPRELEVLRLIAQGITNKAIAAELGLSVRTIDRHVSNLLTKIDVDSRAAATAYAYENGLVQAPG